MLFARSRQSENGRKHAEAVHIRFTSGAQVNIGVLNCQIEVKISRGILAIVCGFIVFVAIVRVTAAFAGTLSPDAAPMTYMVLSIVWTVAGAILAGYITARIAGSHEFPYSAALGLMMVILGVVSMRQEGVAQPGWRQIAIAGCGPISAMIGAALRVLTKTRIPPARQAAGSRSPASQSNPSMNRH
jgi:hypothetical protein